MHKKVAFVVAGLLVAASPLLAAAQSDNSSALSRLEALIAQMRELQAQLLQLQGSGEGTSSPIPPLEPEGMSPHPDTMAKCLDLRYSIGPDDTDAETDGEVSRLQRFLGGRGMYSGPITGYAGPRTVKAIQNWQSTNGLVSSGTPDSTGYGYLGPKSRAKMACTPITSLPGVSFQVTPESVNSFTASSHFGKWTDYAYEIDWGEGDSSQQTNRSRVVTVCNSSWTCSSNVGTFHIYKQTGEFPVVLYGIKKNETTGEVINRFVVKRTSVRVSEISGEQTTGIQITSPNGGEEWEIGQLHTITWAPYSYSPTVQNGPSDVTVMLEKKCISLTESIQCEKDGYRSIGKVMDQGKASLHTYFNLDSYSKWAEAGQYYVRAINTRTGATDRSDAPFTLLPRGVDLKVNGSDGPIQLYNNQPITVSLKAGATFESCTVSGAGDQIGASSIEFGNKYVIGQTVNGYAYVPYAGGVSTSIYVVCTKADGTQRSDSVQVNVDGTAASVKIIYQNGGEKVVLGEPSTVTFSMSGVQSYSAALYRNDQWQHWIYKDVPAGKEGFTWTPTVADLGAVNEMGQVFKIYITGKKTDGTGYVDDKSDGPFTFIPNPVTPATATYKGYLNDSLFITTNNVSEAYALENCKKNAANNPTKSIRCTWGEKEIYNAPASPVTPTNPVINSFTASPASIARAQVATLSWSASGVANGGCYIFANGGSQTITHSSNWGGTGTVTVSPEATTSYTLWCTSSWKDGSPVATKTLTVTLNPFTASAPTCSISYLPSTISAGQTLLVSWAGTAGVTRTYTLARNGQKYFTSGNIAASGNASALYSELGGPGTIVRTDTVTNSGGTGTCTASVTVAGNDRIVSPNALTAGQSITSPNGQYKATYQGDGHFVVYSGNTPVWYTGSYGVNPGQAVMQADGNFVNYNAEGEAYWHTQTYGRGTGPYSLMIQDNGTLVIKDSTGASIWATGTVMAASNTQSTNLASSLSALQSALQALTALFAR